MISQCYKKLPERDTIVKFSVEGGGGEEYDLVQLEQYIMNLCTFRSENFYSVFISILSLKAFSLKILQFMLCVRGKQRYVLL